MLFGEAPLALTDNQWVQAYMTARELAEENEFKITGLRPSMFEPKMPNIAKFQKKKTKPSTGPKKILPPIEELTEERFYELPTKMIPMDQNRDEHLDLNRYRNILPYNDSWVQLTETIGVTKKRVLANQQYVNANYIPNFSGKNPRAYIACQGPKENGLPQFWRMVWQEKARSIAMLTGLVEKGRNKCAQYWPGKPGEQIQVSGMTIVCLSAQRIKKNKYITTELEITGGNEKRLVTHFWFDCWPDLGVPSFKDGLHLQSLLDDANKLNDADSRKRGSKAPIIVHCSAGIGRTGVLISLDHAMESLARQNNTTFNLIQTIDLLRNHRGGMLQTWEQATFLLKLLHRAFKEQPKAAADTASPQSTPVKSTNNPAPTKAIRWQRSQSGAEITEEFI